MRTFLDDVRLALRSFARTPGFALAAVLSLAIGIGANSALFSVLNALLLRPLPYADADRLAILWNRSPGLNIDEDWFSTAQYFDIRTQHGGFEDLAIALGANFNLSGDGEPERVGVIRVSANLLPMLGARPVHGRLFDAADDRPGAPAVAVLHHGTWLRRYGGDAGVIGRTIHLNGQPYTVVGILHEGFSLPREVLPTLGVVDDGEVLLPLPLGSNAANIRTREDYNIIGKLRPGVALADAQREMDALTARLRADYPAIYPPNGGLTFSIVPLLDEVVGDVRLPLLVLAASVGFVLLIACANVANLLLSRALTRRRDMAVRAALGAGRGRLLGQVLTESLVLAAAGAIAGVVLAFVAVRWVHVLQPPNVPRLPGIAIDGGVLLVTAGLALLSGLLFGLVPALGAGNLDLQRHLRDAGRGAAGAHSVWGRGNHLRRLLVVTELALSVVLLIGAGLLIRSFVHLQGVPPGFRTDNVLTLELSLTGRKYPDAGAVRETYRRLWERLEQLPGVDTVGGVTTLPLSNRFAWGPITIEGRPPPPGQTFINADQRTAGGRYFEAMDIPLVRGRLFEEADTPDQPRAVIVDDRLARELFPDEDPIGRRLRFGDIDATNPWETIVGVVGQVRHYGLDAESRIALYRPITQSGARTMFVVLETAVAPASLVPAVREAIAAIDPDLPLTNVATMRDRLDRSLAQREFAMVLLTMFAGLALALAAIGVYGVMAYLVAQGTRELGIRLALGATPASILGLVVRHGMTVAAIGVALGLAGAAALTQLMTSLLFGVRADDLLTFTVIGATLGVVALVASWVPARRAARIDPMVTLRSE